MEEDVLLQSVRVPAVTAFRQDVASAQWPIVLVAAVVLGLTACSSGTDRKSSAESATTTTVDARSGMALEGRIFVVAGEQSGAADLYEMQTGPLRLTRLTTVGRVSAVGGCNELLVTAAAQPDVGLIDTIQAFRDGRLQPVDGLGSPKGFVPALDADCRLAFTDVDRTTPDLTNRLHLWDPKGRTGSVLERGPDLGGLDWGPDGRLAVVANQGGSPGQPTVSTGVVVISPDGSKQTIPAPAPDLGGLAWGPSATMALVRINAKATLFFNPDTGARSELAGWFPLAWSPDGQQLLVTDSADHREVGMVTASDLATVRPVGNAELGVFSAVWLPASATPV